MSSASSTASTPSSLSSDYPPYHGLDPDGNAENHRECGDCEDTEGCKHCGGLDLWVCRALIGVLSRMASSVMIVENRLVRSVIRAGEDYSSASRKRRQALMLRWTVLSIVVYLIVFSIRKSPKLWKPKAMNDAKPTHRSFAFSHNDEMQGDDALVRVRERGFELISFEESST